MSLLTVSQELLSAPRGCLIFLPNGLLHLQAGDGAQICLVPQISDFLNQPEKNALILKGSGITSEPLR